MAKRIPRKLLKEFQQNYKYIDSAVMNSYTYDDYILRFERIALSMFEWVNLPDSMNERWLERTLYFKGRAGLLKDPTFGFINTSVADGSQLNIYGLPTSLECYSHQYYKKRRLYSGLNKDEEDQEFKDAVLVLNDEMAIPTCGTIELYCKRLAEAQRIIDVNVNAQKTPVMLIVDEDQRIMMENLYQQYNGNAPFIFGDSKTFDVDYSGIRVLDTKAPYVVDKLMAYKNEILNEALTFLGINNIQLEKKERLVSGEVDSNNELINFNLQSRLAPRLRACKEFNELFGLTGTDKEISVRVRSDLYNIIKRELSTISDFTNDIEDYEDLKDGDKRE